MNRLRLEGTPRIKRERRQHAPPISPLAADTDFTDFMIPMGDNGQDFDFGTAAMKMLEGIRQTDGDDFNAPPISAEPADLDDEPPSPSPGMAKGTNGSMVLIEEDEPRPPGEYRRSLEARRSRRMGSVDRRGSSGSAPLDDLRETKENGDGMEYIEEASREE